MKRNKNVSVNLNTRIILRYIGMTITASLFLFIIIMFFGIAFNDNMARALARIGDSLKSIYIKYI